MRSFKATRSVAAACSQSLKILLPLINLQAKLQLTLNRRLSSQSGAGLASA